MLPQCLSNVLVSDLLQTQKLLYASTEASAFRVHLYYSGSVTK